jgi:RNA polymerase sigma-70 factor (ECF subfamily)
MTDWEGIVRKHAAATFATAWRILGHAADSEDVVQEVFLQAHQLQRAQQVQCWEGLLRRLAVWRALDRLRSRRPTVELDICSLASRTAGPEEAAILQELHLGLREAIARLSERQATVFCLRHFEGLTPRGIADMLNITPGAVAATLHKARLRLASVLAQHIQGSGVRNKPSRASHLSSTN